MATSFRQSGSIGTKRGLVSGLLIIAASSIVASCAVPPSAKRTASAPAQASSEYFAESEYGVPASPRMVAYGDEIPKGGGRYQVGDPYKVRGKTYKPRENENYNAVGLASWYGSAFHGRKTANGEIYDMGELTAAHPTLPLPSYVRVTNLANDRSVVVRINDRGPFSKGRIIDVSSTAAEMLDFKRAGTAKVKVEYVGKARMDGLDRQMLVASYRGPNDFGGGNSIFAAATVPHDSKGVSRNNQFVLASATPAKPRKQKGGDGSMDLFGAQRMDSAPVVTPAYMPSTFEHDPLGPLILRTGFSMSYAPMNEFSPAHQAAAEMSAAGNREVLVQIGTFGEKANAQRVGDLLEGYGRVDIAAVTTGERSLYTLRVAAIGAPDDVIAAARKAGIRDAFVLSQ